MGKTIVTSMYKESGATLKNPATLKNIFSMEVFKKSLNTPVKDNTLSYIGLAFDFAFFLTAWHIDDPVKYATERGWVLN